MSGGLRCVVGRSAGLCLSLMARPRANKAWPYNELTPRRRTTWVGDVEGRRRFSKGVKLSGQNKAVGIPASGKSMRVLMLAVAAVIFVGCAVDPAPPAPAPEASRRDAESSMPTTVQPPAMIVAERGGFIPEGVEYDATSTRWAPGETPSYGRFLTGSLTEGSIFEIHHDGRVTTVVNDPDLVSSVGIEVNERRNRLLVANSDRSSLQSDGAGQAKLGVYDLTTGARIAMVDLAVTIAEPPSGATYFANDVAVAEDGTAYVTDSRMGVIYRVNTAYEASVLHRFKDFRPNGVISHPAGYLLAGGGPMLWKVPLDDPAGATQVTLPEEVPGQDGMVWTADGRLAIVSNSGNRVVALTSEDDWATAQLAGVATYETQATTAAVVGDDIYVVHPHVADEDPPSIERVVFQ